MGRTRILFACSLALLPFGASGAAPESLIGDTVTAHLYEQFLTADFSPSTAVVGSGVEFSVDLNAQVTFSVDVHDVGFRLIYQNDLVTGFNAGLTELVISDLDFTPAASVVDVLPGLSSFPADSFAELNFDADSITIVFKPDLQIPNATNWQANFTIVTPEPSGSAAGLAALAVLGVVPGLTRRALR